MYILLFSLCAKAVSELVAMAVDTTVARGVAKGVLYFNAWWRGDTAVVVAVAANSDTALESFCSRHFTIVFIIITIINTPG